MLQAYLDHGMTETAVFEFFVRKLPARRGFLMAAGLEQALEFLEHLRFSAEELDWLARTRPLRQAASRLPRRASASPATSHAMPEGTVFFADEPILRVTAPLPQAQLVETRLINLLHFQTLIASKAARMVLAAPGKLLVDFGLRRAHGAEAGLLAARASYLAGFAGTATVLAGTAVRHSALRHDGAFLHPGARRRERGVRALRPCRGPNDLMLLIDTYDTEAAARKVVALAPRLHARASPSRGVRLDSGDLAEHARGVRRILDDGRARGRHDLRQRRPRRGRARRACCAPARRSTASASAPA